MKKSEYSPERKYEFVISILKNEEKASEICRRESLSPNTLCKWKELFITSGKKGLEGKTEEYDPEKEKLKREKEELQKLVAELSVENRLLKKNTSLV